MELELIRQQLYRRYIEPTKVKREKYIGVEIEMPIVNSSKNAVDFEVIHAITKRFISHFKFTVVGTDDDGNIYSAQNPINGDILSYDCSYNNTETIITTYLFRTDVIGCFFITSIRIKSILICRCTFTAIPNTAHFRVRRRFSLTLNTTSLRSR